MLRQLEYQDSVNTASDIQEICKPLFACFNINFFRYLKVFPDGSRIHLCSNPEWTEHFYQEKLHHLAWYDATKIRSSKNVETLWDQAAIEKDNKVGIDARTIFNMHHGISIFRSSIGYYEVFDLATEKSNEKINEIYLANMQLFERFFYYFREQAAGIINSAEKNPIRPHTLMKSWSDKKDSSVAENKLSEFLDATKTQRYYISAHHQTVYLTQKEMECACWSVLGKTAEETALILNSSPRTISIHLDNARRKLGCSKIQQLIKIIIDSGIIDVFMSSTHFYV